MFVLLPGFTFKDKHNPAKLITHKQGTFPAIIEQAE